MKRKCGLLGLLLLISCLLFFGCQKQEQEKVRILFDIPPRTVWADDFSYLVQNEKEVIGLYMERYGGGPTRDKIELEFLPENTSERSVRIQSLRTEIMAGNGPDIFIVLSDPLSGCVGSFLWNIPEQKETAKSGEQLFLSPPNAIKSRLFLPLDSYLKTAEHLDLSQIPAAFLDAGKSEEGQTILPITVTVPIATCLESSLPEQLPATWDAGIRSDNSAVQNSYATGVRHCFSNLFGSLTEQDKLTFTEEELLQRVKMALAASDWDILNTLESTDVYVKSLSSTPFAPYEHDLSAIPFPAEKYQGFLSVRSLSYQDLKNWDNGWYDYRWAKETGKQKFFGLHNVVGGTTAQITSYACINRNTKHPEAAFRILDTMLSTEMLSGFGFTDPIDPVNKRSYQMLLYWGCFGVPARSDLMLNGEQTFNQTFLSQYTPDFIGQNEELFAEYTALRDEVTTARFYGPLDAELQTMYEACLEAETDEEIEKIVSKAYDTMLMILAES